jgi:hypothetical protein
MKNEKLKMETEPFGQFLNTPKALINPYEGGIFRDPGHLDIPCDFIYNTQEVNS